MAQIIPLIFGAGAGALGMARDFYEKYGLKSTVAAPEELRSRITGYMECPPPASVDDIILAVGKLAKKYPGGTPVLLSTGAETAALLGRAADRLPVPCAVPYPADGGALARVCDSLGGVRTRGDVRYIVTSYSDKSGNVRAICSCELLRDIPSIRRHAALFVSSMPKEEAALKAALDSAGYRGFASFLFSNDRSLVGAEPYQGFDCRYAAAAGFSPASLTVRDLVFREELSDGEACCELFWRDVSEKAALSCADAATAARARRLAAEGKETAEPRFPTAKKIFSHLTSAFMTGGIQKGAEGRPRL